MAITKIGATDDELDVKVNNGDLQALNEICREWGFKDRESVLRFALAAMTKATDNMLYILNDEGEKVGVQPAEAVRKREHNPANA